MLSRAFRSALALAAVAVLVAGCTPPDDPADPAPTFTSDAEAFASAEATYRAYVEALNQVDLSDPGTFEGVYQWTTGDTYAESRTTLTNMNSDGWTVVGESIPLLVVPLGTYDDVPTEVELAVCLDVSTVDVLDAEGVSMVDGTRPDIQSMLVSLALESVAPLGWQVSSITGRDGEPLCD